MNTICLHGPESTGKSTLASELAAHFHTLAVPEFGRYYCEALGNECDMQDLRAIRAGHDLLVREARRKAKNLLILDTDAVMTAIWADVLLGNRPADLDRIDDPADLYLLCDIDVPFVADGVRYFPDPKKREQMFEQCRAELMKRALPFVTISGDHVHRLNTAIEAIAMHFPDLA
jgi:HTH-type transcriptional regulator, transcriptional repressor of NAD biosynthesis genes